MRKQQPPKTRLFDANQPILGQKRAKTVSLPTDNSSKSHLPGVSQCTMLSKSGEWSRLLKSVSDAAKWIDIRPASDAIAVSANACFSASVPLILRTTTAAVSSEEIVAAANESPVEMVKSNFTPCWKSIPYQEDCSFLRTESKHVTDPAPASPSTCFIMIWVPFSSRTLQSDEVSTVFMASITEPLVNMLGSTPSRASRAFSTASSAPKTIVD